MGNTRVPVEEIQNQKYARLDGRDGRLENTQGKMGRDETIRNSHRLGRRDER